MIISIAVAALPLRVVGVAPGLGVVQGQTTVAEPVLLPHGHPAIDPLAAPLLAHLPALCLLELTAHLGICIHLKP